MKPGDLVIFAWPSPWAKAEDHPSWKKAKTGLLMEVTMRRPGDEQYGDELLVLHEGERWSVPSTWCRPVEEQHE